MREQLPNKGKPIICSQWEQIKGQTDSPIGRDNILFFGGDDEQVRFVADEDDEMRTMNVPQIHVAASEY